VFREEIWVEVKRENEAAAGAADATLPTIATDGAPSPVGQSGLTVTTD
jgi:hypothetical protein